MSKIIILILSICVINANCFLFGADSTKPTTKLTTTTTTTKAQIITKPSITPFQSQSSTSVKPALSLNQILQWSESDVTKWSTDHKFSYYIAKTLQGFNGAYLRELHYYQTNSPEVFISLIKQVSVDTFSFMHFSLELKKLFTF